MGSRSVLVLFFTVALWFIGTNHCAFGVCPHNSSSSSSTGNAVPADLPQHNHGEQSHSCGTPCGAVARLSPSQDSIAKIALAPDLSLGAVLNILLSSINVIESIIAHPQGEVPLSSECSILIVALKDAPNAPPVIL